MEFVETFFLYICAQTSNANETLFQIHITKDHGAHIRRDKHKVRRIGFFF